MTIWPALLLAVPLFPVAGAISVWAASFVRSGRACQAVAVTAASGSFLASTLLLALSPPGTDNFVFLDAGSLLTIAGGAIEIRFSLGLDGPGLPFVGMTTLLTLTGLLAADAPGGGRDTGYFGLLLLLEASLLGAFLTRDVILFHLFAESATICLFLLIGIWGNRRRPAALMFFIFGFCGGLLMLTGLLAMASWNHSATGRITTSLNELTTTLVQNPIPAGSQTVILLLLVAGLGAKSAMVPLHGWLPTTLAEAPTAARLILVGAALQVGAYGLMRFAPVLLPDAVSACSVWLAWLFVAGIIFGAIMAILQSDLRRLLGYACASQMGFCMLGLLSANDSAAGGAMIKLIGSGLALGGLLLLLAVVQQPADSGPVESPDTCRPRRPIFVTFVLLFAAGSVGLPGTPGFIGMRSILSNLPGQSGAIFGLCILGVALGLCHTLKLTRRMLVGREGLGFQDQPRPPMPTPDLSSRQVLAAGLLAVCILGISLFPDFFTNRLGPTRAGPSSEQPQISDKQTTNSNQQIGHRHFDIQQ